MDDKESILKKVEDGIKGAAKAVENFADEVAAPQAPVVLIPDKDAATRSMRPRLTLPARNDGS
jgi:hypothetical protein